MAKPPKKRSVLPRSVALQVAEIAHVPAEELDQFCDLLYGTVQVVWDLDRRGLREKPGRALLQAAGAARKLHERVDALNKQDRAWVKKLMTQSPWYDGWLHDLPQTTWRLASLLATAIGKSQPPGPGQAARLKAGGGKPPGTVKDAIFGDFIRHLTVDAEAVGGKLTFEKNYKKGTFFQAIDILRPHLPNGLIPNVLPLGTIQNIITDYRDYYTGVGLPPPKGVGRRRTRK